MKKKIQAATPIYIGDLNGTPLGDFRLAASDLGLVAVEWADSQPEFDSYLARLKRPIQPNQKKIAPYAKELREYLNRKRTAFTIPIDWTHFTPFQREALQAVFPTLKVVGVSSRGLLGSGSAGGGSFHCITQQEPA